MTIFLTDLDNFAAVNEIMAEYFDEPYPARAAVQVIQDYVGGIGPACRDWK